MYKEFYGISEDPFQINPDLRFLYLSEQHRAAFAHLTYALNKSKGFTVITGEAGTGKTTLIQMMLARLDGHTRTAHLFNPKLSTRDFLKYICDDLGLNTEGLASKGELLTLLHKFLLECYARQERVVLVVDEAQTLSPTLLEEVRLLTNLETPKSKLMQVILVGQPELDKILSEQRFRQLRQRISVRYHLDALDQNQTNEYIEHRLKVAGYRGKGLFEPAAVRQIWKFSRGIPRIINTLCDSALVIGHAASRKTIDGEIAREAIRDISYMRPEAGTFFRRPAFAYAASGVFLAGALVLGTLAFSKHNRGLPPVTVIAKSIEPEKNATVNKGWALSLVAQQQYGLVNPTVLDILLDHNPQITDVNQVPAEPPMKVPPLENELFLGADPDGRYHIYLGTFDDQRSMQTLMQNPLLQGKTFTTAIRRVSNDIFWNRLTAGGFQTEEDALQVFGSLKQQGALPAFPPSH